MPTESLGTLNKLAASRSAPSPVAAPSAAALSQAAAAASAAGAAVIQQNQTSNPEDSSKPAPFISPRIRTDSVAGRVVIEFRDANSGEVSNQIPSRATLAYLRAGLSVDGTQNAGSGAGNKESEQNKVV